MKWSDLNSDFYIPYDENQKAIRGFWLTTLGIDLEDIPPIFHEPFPYYEGQNRNTLTEHKVFLDDIVGTSHQDYGGMEIIESYIRIKRANYYIKKGSVTRNKYLYMLKKSVYDQDSPVQLSRLDNGKYFIDGNGNHRVILYKMMMIAECVDKYPFEKNDYYELNYIEFNNIKKKYWLNALVNDIETSRCN